ALRFHQVDRTRSFVGVTEARTILQKSPLLARCKIWESFGTRGTSKSEEAITIDSGETCKSFIQLFAAHAFNGIPPEALHFSDDTHLSFSVDCAVGPARFISSFAGKVGSRTFRALSMPATGSLVASSNPI